MDDVKGHIEAREAAEEAMGFVREVKQEFESTGGKQYLGRFWEHLKGMVEKELPPPPDEEVCGCSDKMTLAEAWRFGREPILFAEFVAEFVGMEVDEVPLDRLRWYAGCMFIDDLRRHLNSDRVSSEETG